jgi:hypothetical protein
MYRAVSGVGGLYGPLPGLTMIAAFLCGNETEAERRGRAGRTKHSCGVRRVGMAQRRAKRGDAYVMPSAGFSEG